MPVYYDMADSTYSCFTSLLENIPGWIAEVEDILKSAAVKQEEILFANRPTTPLRKDSKTWSLQSKCSSIVGRDEQARPPIRLDLIHSASPHLAHADALRLSQRKRKNTSVLSDQGSEPAAIRHKSAAVVYYDGDTQKRFEKLVRGIGLSRNAIRKGKMSAKVESLSRSRSSSSDESDSSNSGGEDLGSLKSGYKSTQPSPLTPFSHNDDSEAYDNVDNQMEKAQAFCERAAYQVLKDGDCTLEVSHAKEHFAQALQIAETELPALKKKAERVVERQRRSDERQRAQEDMASQRAATALALKARLQAVVAVDRVSSANSSLEVDPLEVDDSESESESDGEFNVADMQFGKLSQVHCARRAMAH